jgi:hypothetical protein
MPTSTPRLVVIFTAWNDGEPFGHNRPNSGEPLLSTVSISAVQRGFFLPLRSTMTPTMPIITASTPSHAKGSILFLS